MTFLSTMLIYLFLQISVELVYSNSYVQSPMSRYAANVVSWVAVRPFPVEIIDDLLNSEDGDFMEIDNTYYTPWITTAIVIVATVFVFTISFIVYLIISATCCKNCNKKENKGSHKLLIILLNVVLFAVIICMIGFTVIAAFGSSRATQSLKTVPETIDKLGNQADEYVKTNCDILHGIVNNSVQKKVQSLKKKITRGTTDVAKELVRRIREKSMPTIEKVENAINSANVLTQGEIDQFFAFFDSVPEDFKKMTAHMAPLKGQFHKLEKFRKLTPSITIAEKLDRFVKEIRQKTDKQVNDTEVSLNKEIHNHLTAIKICNPDFKLKARINKFNNAYQTYLPQKYLNIPYYLTTIALLIVLIASTAGLIAVVYSVFLYLCSSPRAKRKCEPKTIHNISIALALTVLLLVTLLATSLFLMLGVATDLVCDPWKYPEERPEIFRGLDKVLKSEIISHHGANGTLIEEIFERIDSPVSKVVEQCSDNKTLTAILKLGGLLTIDMAKVSDYMKQIESSIAKSLVPPNNIRLEDKYFEDLELLKNMSLHAGNLYNIDDIENFLYHDFRLLREGRPAIKTARKLKNVLETFGKVPTPAEIKKLLELVSKSRIKQFAHPLVKRFLGTTEKSLQQFVVAIQYSVHRKFLNCGPLKQMSHDLRTKICYQTIDVYNTAWLALFHIAVLLMLLIIIGRYLAILQRPKIKKPKEETVRVTTVTDEVTEVTKTPGARSKPHSPNSTLSL